LWEGAGIIETRWFDEMVEWTRAKFDALAKQVRLVN